MEEAAAACGGDYEPAVVRAQGTEHIEQVLREELRNSEVGCECGRALAEFLVEENERRLFAVSAAVGQELLHGEVGSAASEFSIR